MAVVDGTVVEFVKDGWLGAADPHPAVLDLLEAGTIVIGKENFAGGGPGWDVLGQGHYDFAVLTCPVNDHLVVTVIQMKLNTNRQKAVHKVSVKFSWVCSSKGVQ